MRFYAKLFLIYKISRFFVTMAFRFFTGRPMDGKLRTDSRFLVRGSRALTRTGYASRWAMLPGYKRLLTRLLGAIVTSVTPVAYFLYPLPTQVAGESILGALTAWTGFRTYLTVKFWGHRRLYVKPLAAAIREEMGYHTTLPDRLWLKVPRDYKLKDKKVMLKLPVSMDMTGERRIKLTELVARKLAYEETTAEWHLDGPEPYVLFYDRPQPPKKVPFKAIEKALVEAPDSSPVLGIGRNNRVISVDLDSESPHVLFSISTGGGKSVATRLVATQILNRGGEVYIFDIKQHSHRWAFSLDRVHYLRDIALMHKTLIELDSEGDHRNTYVLSFPEEIDTTAIDVGHRIGILIEEQNALIGKLKSYWQKTRGKDDPKQSPAIEALGNILFMGRYVKMNVLSVAQLASAKTMGGPEMRENYSTRILARYSQNAWKMLVPEIWPMPRKSSNPGRMQVVSNGIAHETQIAFLTDAEAKYWATHSNEVARLERSDQAKQLPHEVPLEPNGITLSEAKDMGIISDIKAAQNARDRSHTFPKPNGRNKKGALLYDGNDLSDWERNRPKRKDPTLDFLAGA